MTGPEFRAARDALGLTGAQIAEILGYSSKSQIAYMERQDHVPGPTALAVRALLVFGLPNNWPGA